MDHGVRDGIVILIPKLRAYAIDQGGVKARLVIERLRKAEAAEIVA